MLASWLLVLSVIGYSLVGLLASLWGLDAGISSIPFRVAVVVLALFVIALNLLNPLRPVLWLSAFWIAYSARLAWDFLAGVPQVDQAISFFVVGILTPAIALWWAKPLDWDQTGWRFVLYGGLVCVLALTAYMMGMGLEEEEGARLSFEKLNPITIGHTAVTTIIAAMCLQLRRSFLWRLLLLAVIGVAVWCLLISASRGPLIALAVCGVAFVLLTRRWKLVLLVGIVAAVAILSEESVIAERFAGLTTEEIEEPSALERIAVMTLAYEQFKESPVLGSAYTEREFLTYPHNIFLETMMALGLVGLLLLVLALKRGFVGSLEMLRAGHLLPPLLLLQYFVNEMLSGSLYTSTAFWALLVVISRAK